MEAMARLAGVKIDPQRLDFELARRGLRARDLSARSGVGEATLSKLRHGYAVTPATFHRLVRALTEIPPLDGADLLLAQPGQKKTAGASTPPTVHATEGSTSATSRNLSLTSRPASKSTTGAI